MEGHFASRVCELGERQRLGQSDPAFERPVGSFGQQVIGACRRGEERDHRPSRGRTRRELDGPETEVFSRTTQKTADLVEGNWPAIQRVAAALLSRPPLTEEDIDALIAAHDN